MATVSSVSLDNLIYGATVWDTVTDYIIITQQWTTHQICFCVVNSSTALAFSDVDGFLALSVNVEGRPQTCSLCSVFSESARLRQVRLCGLHGDESGGSCR